MDNMTSPPSSRPDGNRRLGDILREARIAKGLELSDVAEVTHVRKEYLKALDEGRYEDLPEDVYARNFVRLYAQTLGISDTQLLEKFKRERHPESGGAEPPARPKAAPLRAPTLIRPPARAQAERDPAERSVAEPQGSAEAPDGTRARTDARPVRPQPAVIPVTRASARERTPSSLDRDFWSGDPSKRRGGPLLWLVALLGLLAVVFGVWWALGNLRPGPADIADEVPQDATTAPASPAAPAVIPLEPGAQAPAIGVPADPGATAPSSVTLAISSTPPGAEVSVDNFYLGNTPLQFPIRARESGVIQLNLEGYEPVEFSENLASDRSFNVELTPLSGTAPAAAGGEGTLVITVENGPSWLEVWSGGARNQGERLLWTTAQPGQRFEFPLPVYVHAGAASNIRLSVNGQSAGALGSGGEVVGRLFR